MIASNDLAIFFPKLLQWTFVFFSEIKSIETGVAIFFFWISLCNPVSRTLCHFLIPQNNNKYFMTLTLSTKTVFKSHNVSVNEWSMGKQCDDTWLGDNVASLASNRSIHLTKQNSYSFMVFYCQLVKQPWMKILKKELVVKNVYVHYRAQSRFRTRISHKEGLILEGDNPKFWKEFWKKPRKLRKAGQKGRPGWPKRSTTIVEFSSCISGKEKETKKALWNVILSTQDF